MEEKNRSKALYNILAAGSARMKKIADLILQISKVDSTVLLLGPSGVGKSMIGKVIHDNSLRGGKAFVTIDCTTLSPQLLESELFGYEGGSFTGAERSGKTGFVEIADGGTLFLDEIGELSLSLQTKLLRMLQDREIFRVGSNRPIPVNIRVISASNRNLETMVREKQFRSDLFYRLKVIPIPIPSLAERDCDINILADIFLKKYNQKYGFNKQIAPELYCRFRDYPWPGNVRELENTIEYLVATSTANTIGADLFLDMPKGFEAPDAFSNYAYTGLSLAEAKEHFEKQLLLDVMKKSSGTLEMAELLRTDRSTITRRLKKHGIKPVF